MKKNINSKIIVSVITAVVFLISGAIPITIDMGMGAGLTLKSTASILMCGTGLGAILSIYLSKKLKMPIFIAPSITAIAVMIPMFEQFSLGEMVFAYIVTGITISVFGITGIIGLIGKYIPLPIVLGMVAGVFMEYILRLITSVQDMPLYGVLVLLPFFCTALITKKIPPQAASLVMAIIITVIVQCRNPDPVVISAEIYPPEIILPVFSLKAVIYVSIPMIIMVVADIYKGYGVLKANGFEADLNTITKFCGIGSVICSFGLGHSISMAGPAMAIISSKDVGNINTRYLAGILFSAVTVIVVILAGPATSLLGLMPKPIVYIICGLAMTGLLTSSLEIAFRSGKLKIGALTSFAVGLSHLSLFGIGPAVWAIIFGILASLLVEKKELLKY